jgi:cytidylate kinase
MKKIVVVISGPPGAGTSTLAKAVAKKLKLRYLSPGKTYKIYLDESEAKAALGFWQTKFGRSKELHKKLDNDQLKEAKKGSIVICGKLSIHFLRKLTNYKIWLDVPLKIRAERTAERDGIAVDEALKEIAKREELERFHWKRLYGFDYFDQKKMADFVIDTSNLTVRESVKQIINFIKRK